MIISPDDTLHRVGTDDGVELWLLDQQGNFVEDFWQK